jgi:hypothetical protein
LEPKTETDGDQVPPVAEWARFVGAGILAPGFDRFNDFDLRRASSRLYFCIFIFLEFA